MRRGSEDSVAALADICGRVVCLGNVGTKGHRSLKDSIVKGVGNSGLIFNLAWYLTARESRGQRSCGVLTTGDTRAGYTYVSTFTKIQSATTSAQRVVVSDIGKKVNSLYRTKIRCIPPESVI